MRLLGIDPGLRNTGWGLIEVENNHLKHVADGRVVSRNKHSLAERLVQLFDGLDKIITGFKPDEVAVEETFVNVNATSTLKLGQARGVTLLVPARRGLPVAEYAPNMIKKSVVGVGHANKEQVQMMVKTLLPGCLIESPDAADALAVAICHAHQRESSGLAAQLAGASA